MKALLATLSALASIVGANYLLDALTPAYEEGGAQRTISAIVTEAQSLALLSGDTQLAPYLQDALADTPYRTQENIDINGSTITVHVGYGCYQATVETVNSPLEIAACA